MLKEKPLSVNTLTTSRVWPRLCGLPACTRLSETDPTEDKNLLMLAVLGCRISEEGSGLVNYVIHDCRSMTQR